MNIKDILSKTIAAVTTAAVFAMPLIACGGSGSGGDDGNGDIELRGERVTEQEWKNGIDALRTCKNYTEKVILESELEKGMAAASSLGNTLYKFDNGTMNITMDSYGIINAPYMEMYVFYDKHYYCSTNNLYYRYTVVNWKTKKEYFEKDGVLHSKDIYYYDGEWEVRCGACSNYWIGRVPTSGCDMLWGGFWNIEAIICENYALSIYNDYSKSYYTISDGSYKVTSVDEYGLDLNCYFINGILIGAKTHTDAEMMYVDGIIMQHSMKCSDFGTTVIDVPSEVRNAIAVHEATKEHEWHLVQGY